LSSQDPKSNLKRLERLLEVRQTFVSAAETRVKQAERQVMAMENAAETAARKIHDTRAAMACVQRTTGDQLQSFEKYIRLLIAQAEQAQQALEAARRELDMRRAEWTEAMREQKIIERMRERRFQEWQRYEDVEDRKAVDENSVVRYVRARINP
jgi:flagellar export protein FliJ